MQREITGGGPLLDGEGRLSQRGYAHSLLLDYRRDAIKAPAWRIKEWDYYLISDGRKGLALTLADNAYMGLVSVSALDFEAAREKTSSLILPFTWGKMGLPESSRRGDAAYKNGRADFRFANNGEKRRLQVSFLAFDQAGGKPVNLEADIILTEEPRDSLVIATPFPENPRAFYYNQKIIGQRAQGWVRLSGPGLEKPREFRFDPEDSFGLLDWGRGVWTYDNTWYWGAAMGLIGGRPFGFNIGGGFGDTSAASENILFYDGQGHKLEEVRFLIPRKPDGGEDYLSPWRFASSDGRLELDFRPCLDRAAKTGFGPLLSDQHQVFGHFSGQVILDDGQRLQLNDFFGFAEKVRNKW